MEVFAKGRERRRLTSSAESERSACCDWWIGIEKPSDK